MTRSSSFCIRSSNSDLDAASPSLLGVGRGATRPQARPRETQLEQGASRLHLSFRFRQNLHETGRWRDNIRDVVSFGILDGASTGTQNIGDTRRQGFADAQKSLNNVSKHGRRVRGFSALLRFQSARVPKERFKEAPWAHDGSRSALRISQPLATPYSLMLLASKGLSFEGLRWIRVSGRKRLGTSRLRVGRLRGLERSERTRQVLVSILRPCRNLSTIGYLNMPSSVTERPY